MLSLVFLLAAQPIQQPIYGIARAGDGDSLQIGSTRIRLFGIDAPELDQTCTRAGATWNCGQEAAERLSKLVTGREVRCAPISTDRYDRILARCSIIGTDVNRTMVATGYAVAFRKYSSEYVSAEESAELAKRGIWSGAFEMPSEVRAANRGPVAGPGTRRSPRVAPLPKTVQRAFDGCVIKGNRSRRGDWIYHLPGMPYYERTRAEDMFCTEAQARAAGYRRAIVR